MKFLKINLTPEDYTEKVESELKKYQKSMNLPGFRPGHVPVGLVKKRYGKSILIDELNKIVSGSIESYITEQNLICLEVQFLSLLTIALTIGIHQVISNLFLK